MGEAGIPLLPGLPPSDAYFFGRVLKDSTRPGQAGLPTGVWRLRGAIPLKGGHRGSPLPAEPMLALLAAGKPGRIGSDDYYS